MDGGTMGSRRHLNIRGKSANLPAITERDWKDIDFGIRMGVDFYALSFVRDAACIYELQAYLKRHGSTAQVRSCTVCRADSSPRHGRTAAMFAVQSVGPGCTMPVYRPFRWPLSRPHAGSALRCRLAVCGPLPTCSALEVSRKATCDLHGAQRVSEVCSHRPCGVWRRCWPRSSLQTLWSAWTASSTRWTARWWREGTSARSCPSSAFRSGRAPSCRCAATTSLRCAWAPPALSYAGSCA